MPVAAVTTTASVVLEGNAKRKSLVFTSDPGNTGNICLRQGWKPPPTTTDYDYIIGPGIAISFSLDDDGPMIKEKWQAIASALNQKLAYQELLE